MAREAAWMARCVGRGEWAPLSSGDIEALSNRLQAVAFRPGAPIFRQGAPPAGVWIVREGRVEIVANTRGRKKTILQVLRPGDVEGDIPLILGMPLPYTARSVGEVSALRLSAEDFEQLILTQPGLARRWLTSVSARLLNLERRILQMGMQGLKAQVAVLLLDEQWNGVVELPQGSLAALLAVTRQSMNKVLRELQNEGSISLSYGRIEIKDDAALRRTAGIDEAH